MTFIKVKNEYLSITLLPCICTNIGDVCMNICVCMYLCANNLLRYLDKNILSNCHYESGGATEIGTLTGQGHTMGGAGRWFPP